MDDQTRIKELETLLDEWNQAYRFDAKQIVPDSVYDEHLEELADLDPDNSRCTKVGETPPDDERKEKLPIIMASMNKVKSFEELVKWSTKNNIPTDAIFCITPKYDALSGLYDVLKSKGWTRGDGAIGQNSDPHFKDILEKYSKDKLESFLQSYQYAPFVYTTGEAIITKEIFQKNHSKEALGEDGFDNGRNRVGGLFNKYKKENKSALSDVKYMRYGFHCGVDIDKSSQIDILNQYFNDPEVPYKLHTISELSTEYLKSLFDEWVKTFEIDGLIIEVNDKDLRNSIGYERSTKENDEVRNPKYARAYKASFEEVKNTKVLDLILDISKLGYIIPVAEVESVMLDGANVTHVTCNNAKMIYDLGIGKGSIIKICRSGGVIPYLIDVVKKSEEQYLFPSTCPCCGTSLVWNDNNTHLMCMNELCVDKMIKQITSFFDILGVANVRESTFRQLFNSGYNTIEKIITMSVNDFKKLERMGNTKSSNIYESIHSKIDGVSLSKLQHASGFFTNPTSGFSLGSRKLILLEHFTQKPSVADIKKIKGFEETSAIVYCSNYDRFFEWLSTSSITIKKDEPFISTGNKCVGMTFIFTGIRRKDIEEIIKKEGGKVVDSMSKNCTHLIMKQLGSGSNKEKKALEYGMTIWEIEQIESFLKS